MSDSGMALFRAMAIIGTVVSIQQMGAGGNSMMWRFGFVFVVPFLMSTQSFAQAPTPSTLPGGASSIQETYQDWRVSCVQQQAGKSCSFSQQQTQQNGQVILSIELTTNDAKSVTGNLVLPFGLALASGATLQVDEGKPDATMPFRTCFPVGCVVPLSFSAEKLAGIRKGKVLKVNAVASADNKPVVLNVSLNGFAEAQDRVSVLAK
ncbi:invasion associated locus B family protein [Phyllobacterium meliloti]|uniref:invasion associated locus B family protein n=1 Tax=Phyllobacterium meliloti TaxID=555317 RepID=UPI001D14144B|nr:invasion associated locus B family protein [Phyllobacterium sp. T1293]UGX89307.1 invasion associated locus B family protein [Phyllobacterium sp. T1293]